MRINGDNFLNNHLIEKVVDLLSLGFDKLLSLSQGNSCSVAPVDIFIPPHRVLSEFELIERMAFLLDNLGEHVVHSVLNDILVLFQEVFGPI